MRRLIVHPLAFLAIVVVAAFAVPGATLADDKTGSTKEAPKEQPAPKWTSPFKDSKSTDGEQTDFNNLVALYDKNEEAADKLEYAKKCGTKADIDAAIKAQKETWDAWLKALRQYVMDYEPNSAFSAPPQPGQRNYNFFVGAMGVVGQAVKKASKYQHKPVGDCPKKAAETTPAKTVPAEVSPTHSSNPHKKHKCREDEACAMEGVTIPASQSGQNSAPASYGTTVVVPADNGTVTEPDEHRPDTPLPPGEPGSPDVPMPPESGPH
jgi:hypothetical protein